MPSEKERYQAVEARPPDPEAVAALEAALAPLETAVEQHTGLIVIWEGTIHLNHKVRVVLADGRVYVEGAAHPGWLILRQSSKIKAALKAAVLDLAGLTSLAEAEGQ